MDYLLTYYIGPPRTEQILWPRHCVQRTWGAELHPRLKVSATRFFHQKWLLLKTIIMLVLIQSSSNLLSQVPATAKTILKGQESFVDAYSCFFDNLKQVFIHWKLTICDSLFYQSRLTRYKGFHLYSSQNESILNEELQKEDITDLFLCGLATDVCVGENLQHHYRCFIPMFIITIIVIKFTSTQPIIARWNPRTLWGEQVFHRHSWTVENYPTRRMECLPCFGIRIQDGDCWRCKQRNFQSGLSCLLSPLFIFPAILFFESSHFHGHFRI